MQFSWQLHPPKMNWRVGVKDKVLISVLGPGRADTPVLPHMGPRETAGLKDSLKEGFPQWLLTHWHFWFLKTVCSHLYLVVLLLEQYQWHPSSMVQLGVLVLFGRNKIKTSKKILLKAVKELSNLQLFRVGESFLMLALLYQMVSS